MAEPEDEERCEDEPMSGYIVDPGVEIGIATREELESIYRKWDEERAKAKAAGA